MTSCLCIVVERATCAALSMLLFARLMAQGGTHDEQIDSIAHVVLHHASSVFGVVSCQLCGGSKQ